MRLLIFILLCTHLTGFGCPTTILIMPSQNPACSGTPVLFTPMITNGGNHPQYKWYVNGVNVGTSSTYSYYATDGDSVFCTLVSNICPGPAAMSNIIEMAVATGDSVSVVIRPSVYAVVSGSSVTLTASAVNEGSTPTYQWQVNGSNVESGASSYIYTPTNNDIVTCVLTSSITGCAVGNPTTSNAITLIVYTDGSACSGTPTVSYGGFTYNTVQIGTQCWLRENLRIGTDVSGATAQTDNSVVERYCYDDDTINCNTSGGLYQWAEAVQYINGATNTILWSPVPTPPIQGLCPSGWHVPSNAEWATMMTYLGGLTTAGGKIKQVGLYSFNSPNSSATNTSGFTSLPTGERRSTGAFYWTGKDALYWTITGGGPATDGYYGGATYNTASGLNGQMYKNTGLAVRCLKD